MTKNISDEIIDRYFDYFKIMYRVAESKQPNFWKAVKILCNDINADISSLIDEEKDFCVSTKMGYRHVSYLDQNVNTVTDLAKIIAKKIIEEESKEVRPVDLFLLNKKMEDIERKLQSHISIDSVCS